MFGLLAADAVALNKVAAVKKVAAKRKRSFMCNGSRSLDSGGYFFFVNFFRLRGVACFSVSRIISSAATQ